MEHNEITPKEYELIALAIHTQINSFQALPGELDAGIRKLISEYETLLEKIEDTILKY